jgi:hypothetical protein
MICPYILGIGLSVTTHDYTYDENGRITSDKSVTQDTQTMFECAKEDCAAWCDGKCSRK